LGKQWSDQEYQDRFVASLNNKSRILRTQILNQKLTFTNVTALTVYAVDYLQSLKSINEDDAEVLPPVISAVKRTFEPSNKNEPVKLSTEHWAKLSTEQRRMFKDIQATLSSPGKRAKVGAKDESEARCKVCTQMGFSGKSHKTEDHIIGKHVHQRKKKFNQEKNVNVGLVDKNVQESEDDDEFYEQILQQEVNLVNKHVNT
jgi:hypothetical protein